MRTILFARVLAVCFLLVCGPAAAEQPVSDATAQLEAKRMEILHHTEALQKIQDPALLRSETQKHFLMTEELLGMMIERQNQAVANAAAQPQGKMRAGGGMMMSGEDAREMGMPQPAGGTSPGSPQPQGQAPMGGGMVMMEGEDAMKMGGMGGASADPSAPMAASTAPQRVAQREALLREITTHSAYLASITDPESRMRETIEHQQMLDRLLELMR